MKAEYVFELMRFFGCMSAIALVAVSLLALVCGLT